MYKVVVADDENMVRLAMHTMMDWEACGFSFCGTAADGIQALALVQEYQPDLVITDIRMPNMDGLELIRKLKERGFFGEILILSNYDDFDLVRAGLRSGAYDYLLKVEISRESLLEKMKEIKGVLDKKEKRKEGMSAAETTERREKLMAKEWEGFLLRDEPMDAAYGNFQLRFYLLRLWPYDGKRQGGVNQQAVKSLLADITQVNQEGFLLTAETNTYVFCDFGEKMFSTDIADKMQTQLELYLNLRSHVVYTEIFGEAKEAKAAYIRSLSALSFLFYEEESSVCQCPAAFAPWRKEGKVGERGAEEDLTAMLLCGNGDMAKKYLEQLLQEHKEKRVDPEQIKTNLFHRLNETYYQLPYREEIEGDIEPIMKQIKEATHISQLRAGAYAFADKGVNKKIGKKEIIELKYYIDHHLHEKLTLSFLKDRVNLSEKYMCTLFKQVTGKSIMEYINEKRMERAGELLLTTEMRMKEISDAVGIPDPFYLSRLFKKHYGMSPTQYKNENPYK